MAEQEIAAEKIPETVDKCPVCLNPYRYDLKTYKSIGCFWGYCDNMYKVREKE